MFMFSLARLECEVYNRYADIVQPHLLHMIIASLFSIL